MRDLLRVRKITPESLKRFLDQKFPESEWLEYKEGVNEKVVKAIAAMANGDGGLIIVGVEEGEGENAGRPGRIVGLSGDTDQEMRLVNMCHDRLDPMRYLPEIQRVQVDTEEGPRDLLVIRVDPERVPTRPVIVRDGQAGKVYIRYGPSTREADPRTLRHFLASGFQAALPPFGAQAPLDFLAPDQQTQQRLKLLIQVAYQERISGSPESLSSMDRHKIKSLLEETPLKLESDDILNLFSWTLRESSRDHLRLVAQRIGDLTLSPPPSVMPVKWLSLWIGWRGCFWWIQMDVGFSDRPSWEDAYTWTLTNLATVSYLGTDWLPRLLSDRLPPGWDPQVRICINPLGRPLTERIQMKRWKEIDSGYDPSWPASIERPLQEEIDVSSLNGIVHQLWSDMLLNLGFQYFEEDLSQHSRYASQKVDDFIRRWNGRTTH